MVWKPNVTVATVVERDGRFLLVEENIGGRRVINQPAGHLEPGETLMDAARRETLEETGWQVELLGVVGASLYHADNGVTYYRTTFFAEPLAHDRERPLDDGIAGTLWLDYEQMRARSDTMRSALVIRSVEQYLRGQRFPLNLFY